jgi:hypothetical protein
MNCEVGGCETLRPISWDTPETPHVWGAWVDRQFHCEVRHVPLWCSYSWRYQRLCHCEVATLGGIRACTTVRSLLWEVSEPVTLWKISKTVPLCVLIPGGIRGCTTVRFQLWEVSEPVPLWGPYSGRYQSLYYCEVPTLGGIRACNTVGSLLWEISEPCRVSTIWSIKGCITVRPVHLEVSEAVSLWCPYNWKYQRLYHCEAPVLEAQRPLG